LKIGFDKARARELQWLFTNRRIEARQREHVLDSFMGFADALGARASARAGTFRCLPAPWPMRRISSRTVNARW
jgi:ADP-heptose:LPS heptosyltransferase